MHSLMINKLGPVEHAQLTEKQLMLFIGSQSSGKSTIAKVVYFFRTIKDDILSLIVKKNTGLANANSNLNNSMKKLLRDKFLQLFGSSWKMERDMSLAYYYTEATFIRVGLKDAAESPNIVWFEMSKDISEFLRRQNDSSDKHSGSIADYEKSSVQEELYKLFDDKYETVYIPAGRSMITLLASQLNYIYATMDDRQKRMIDLCTRNYLENIIKKRPEFENGLKGLEQSNPVKAAKVKATLNEAKQLIEKILNGNYHYNNGDEHLRISSDQYVKINYASSGQQEAVWITNLLFYYVLINRPTFFILEEPESHLFPESQKYITELIALVNNEGHSFLVTTHSPYVLGSINNLMYASQFTEANKAEVNKIINQKFWVNPSTTGAWYLNNGQAAPCIDDEMCMVQNELIDEISGEINSDFDKMLSLKLSPEGGE